jgi:hypothetical protein
MKDEALRLALDALEYLATQIKPDYEHNKAITAIKAALEAKDEPVATKNNDGVTLHLGWDDLPVGTKLYAAPPQRTWIGLTDIDYAGLPLEQVGLVRWAEAKLKEKNT